MAFTSRLDIFREFAQGKGIFLPISTNTGASGTGANASVGHFGNSLHVNNIGTTVPGTLQSMLLPPSSTCLNLTFLEGGANSSGEWYYLCYFYRFGTLNLAATGNQFTHDSWTAPLRRTRFGAATTAINLVPIMYITTATATTAPIIRLRNVAGTNGYVDDEGNTIVGTKSHTFPNAVTAAQSCYNLRLEDSDPSLRDIVGIEVTTAASAGAASIFGVEFLAPMATPTAGVFSYLDTLHGTLGMQDICPATPVSGTLTSYLGVLCVTTITTLNQNYLIIGALD